MIVSVSPHKFSWFCQFLHIRFHDCVDTIMKTYVEKSTQSLKLMWRNWHNHENLCGETDIITKTYVEKLTIMKTYVEKLTQSRKLIWRNWHNHDCVSFSTYVFVIVSVSPHKFSWLCQFLHITFRDCVSFST
jgi:hypothetical protein